MTVPETMRCVLFVDDDPRVLDGLRDLLRKHRRRWDMRFALGGEEGIRALDRGGVDVLVSDMRMPGIDGVALLTYAHLHHPAVVRFILSGFAEEAACLRAVPVAHQFLSKPCDAAHLESAIRRALALRDAVLDDDLRAFLGSVDKLPSQPRLYHELQSLLVESRAGAVEVARLIERDIAMSAKLIQLVNSGFFGGGRRMASIEQAVSLLGMQTIQSLVLTAEVFGTTTTRASLGALQTHALLTARVAAALVPDRSMTDDAFLAGLLHDIGYLVLGQVRPADVDRALCLSRPAPPPADVEVDGAGLLHARVGAYLLGLWGVPYAIAEAALWHHEPRQVAGERRFDLVTAVHIADALASEAQGGPLRAEAPLDLELVAELGLSDRLEGWRTTAEGLANPDVQ